VVDDDAGGARSALGSSGAHAGGSASVGMGSFLSLLYPFASCDLESCCREVVSFADVGALLARGVGVADVVAYGGGGGNSFPAPDVILSRRLLAEESRGRDTAAGARESTAEQQEQQSWQ
jgi:hypothetical protein